MVLRDHKVPRAHKEHPVILVRLVPKVHKAHKDHKDHKEEDHKDHKDPKDQKVPLGLKEKKVLLATLAPKGILDTMVDMDLACRASGIIITVFVIYLVHQDI
jgi:hypothetical protein